MKMPAMKRPAASRKSVDPVKSRRKMVQAAVEDAEGFSDSVREMLSNSMDVTISAFKANRHSLNQRFVEMIGEVLKAEHKRMQKDVQTKDAAFQELTPAKGTREAACEAAKADAEAKATALSNAKQAVTEIGAKLKELEKALKEAQKEQKAGDASLEEVSAKKSKLEDTKKDELAPLLDGSAGDARTKKAKAVLDVGKHYHFDASLLQTAEPVLLKEIGDRGSFDATCLEQLQAAFDAAINDLNSKLEEGAPGKAARAEAVQAAQAAKESAEAEKTSLQEAAQAAKEADSAAKSAKKQAEQSLEDFMPDLKIAGDALDDAKENLKEFEEGAMVAYAELKEYKEGDFKEPEEEEAAPAEEPAAPAGEA